MEIVIATRNKKKIEEIKRITKEMRVTLLTLDDFPGCPDVVEDGSTFEENAIKKAINVAKYTGKYALADDSGLEVYALSGAPGVRSSRYAGDKAKDNENIEKLLSEMRSIKREERRARFVCSIVFASPTGDIKTFYGEVEGLIGVEARGKRGFGYDPVFYPLGYDRTFAEMSDEEKDALSHRGIALRKLKKFLEENMDLLKQNFKL